MSYFVIFLLILSNVFAHSASSIKEIVLQKKISILPVQRLNSLIDMMTYIKDNNINGDFLEAGAMRGGACMVMKAFCNENKLNKKVFVADSFKGFPISKITEESYVNNTTFPFVIVSEEECKNNFRRYNLLDDDVIFIKGFFNESLPQADINNLSILRIDCDMYQSTLDVLENLYDKVSENGFIIIDDYGDFPFCKKAVDLFRQNLNTPKQLFWVDDQCVYWQK